MNKRGLIPIGLAIAGIILMSGALVSVAAEYNYDNNYRKSIIGMTTQEERCTKLEQRFEKEYTKQKCDVDNETKKCEKLIKEFDKKFRKKCEINDEGDEVFLTGTASGQDENGANDKVESAHLNSYDFNDLTGYKFRWTETSEGYEDYAGKSYTILYNTPKCENQGCVILSGFNIPECENCSQPIVKGWEFEVYA